jgi:FdhE protein
VASNFLRRWFGGSRPASGPVEEARAELDRLAGERPALGPLCRWLQELLPDLGREEEAVPVVSLSPEEAAARLAEGVPLLRGLPGNLVDGKLFVRRWQRVCATLEEAQPGSEAVQQADAVRQGRLTPEEMMQAVLSGELDPLRQKIEQQGLDPGLTASLLRYTLFPTFVALEKVLAPLWQGTGWEQGYCQTCGTWPLLGEYRGLDQSRYLRCGLCAAAWEVARLWCPYCGSRDHEQLHYLHAEGEETRYRTVVCDGCRGYVKMVTTLSALPPLHLLVADLATLHLDLAAAERGYTNQP